jgi:hypothetical protein
LTINGLPCRLVRDVNIRMIVDDPQVVFYEFIDAETAPDT